MSEIVLTTLNARYQHTAFGLRYLQANLGDLQDQSVILEFGLKESATEVLDAILAESPRIVGFGVYIWNVEPLTGIVAALKTLRPEIVIILGGPEVSYELDDLKIADYADFIIQGEADITCRKVCEQILSGEPPTEQIISAELPQLDQVRMPYDLYTEEDLQNRVLYVEASRGCPFTCEFCLSALEIPVRQFDVDQFLAEMQSLFDRGARWFKFVDRTFNLNIRIGKQILQFFLDRYESGMFLHFEMIPDRLPEALRELIAKFPAGALQFEIGIQTFNDDVSDLISRKQENNKVAENFEFLTAQTIQVGILKRLKGTPIIRHDDEWQMKYASAPPYEILETKLVSFADIQRLRRFAQLWDRTSNSGNFVETVTLLWTDSSPFESFLSFSDWAVEQVGRSHAISLNRLVELLFQYLTQVKQLAGQQVAESIWRDFRRAGRHDKPKFLREFDLPTIKDLAGHESEIPDLPGRQARHASKLM